MLASVLHGLSGPQWWAIIAALGCHACAIGLHTLAWRRILAHEYGDSNVRWRTVLGGYAAGSAVNALVPARAGVVLKLLVIRDGIPAATLPAVAASLGALALFDVITTTAIVVWAIETTLLPDPGTLANYQAFIGRVVLDHPGAAVAVVAVFVAVALALSLVIRRGLRAFAVEVLRGLRVLTDVRFYALRVVPVQVLNWVAQLAALGFFLAAFGLPVTLRTVLLAQAAKSLAVLIPFTPSGAGAQFALTMLAFGRQFPPLTVSSFAIGARIATSAFNLALGGGAIFALLGTLRWRRALDRLRARGPVDAGSPSEPTPSRARASQRREPAAVESTAVVEPRGPKVAPTLPVPARAHARRRP